MHIRDKKDAAEWHTFPCGKCPECLKRRVSGWSFRLMQEDKVSQSSLFVTLTYNTDHVPLTKNKFMSLCKKDVQLFFKRLRKYHGNKDQNIIRYFVVGEYGSKYGRPHYHLILFNSTIEGVLAAWRVDNSRIGDCHFGKVSGASVGYTLKYMMKPSKVPLHKNDDRVPEFQLCSKGLGKNYLTKAMASWHYKDLENRMYLNIEEGKKIAMPRYYKDKLYDEFQRARIALVARIKAEKDNEKETDKLVRKYGDDRHSRHAANVRAAFEKMYKKSKDGRSQF